MTVEDGALACCAGFLGPLVGLLAMLSLVAHPMLATMNGPGFARFLRAFLPSARRAWFNYAAIFGMIIAPVVAFVALGDDPSGAGFVFAAIGLALTTAGSLLVSNRLAEPNYDVLLAWDAEAIQAGEAGPRR